MQGDNWHETLTLEQRKRIDCWLSLREKSRMKRWVMHHTIVTACIAALVLVVLAIVTGGVQCAAEWWIG